MDVAIKSDIGRERAGNEDSLVVDEKLGVFIVADGMGGHRSGNIASSLACQSAHDYISHHFDHIVQNRKEALEDLLRTAFNEAHDSLKKLSIQNARYKGMGTTLLVLILVDGKGLIGHVGDSRAYIVNKNIIQLTTDHTVREYLVTKKNIKPENISSFSKHCLTQSVGGTKNIVPEITEIILSQKDVLLLCSDGLTDMLTDLEIMKIVDRNRCDLKKMVVELVDAANYNGGKDNISLIAINCH